MATISRQSFNSSEENKFNTFFPIASYVKNMSAEGGHLGWRSGSPDTILKIDQMVLRWSTFKIVFSDLDPK
jgi:hypothetical protein